MSLSCLAFGIFEVFYFVDAEGIGWLYYVNFML